jgi:hypothetical protein
MFMLGALESSSLLQLASIFRRLASCLSQERLSLIHHSSRERMKAPSRCGNFSALSVLREI